MLDKIRHYLKSLPIDKICHFLVGATLFAMLLPFGMVAALLSVIVVANAKELFDYLSYGVFDLKDMSITIIGAICMLFWMKSLIPFILSFA